jgi:hypothetical protein
MFSRARRRRGGEVAVEFCDGCGQVCTPGCRAEARRDEVRAQAAFWAVPIR